MSNDLKEVNKLAKCVSGTEVFQGVERASMKTLNWAYVGVSEQGETVGDDVIIAIIVVSTRKVAIGTE